MRSIIKTNAHLWRCCGPLLILGLLLALLLPTGAVLAAPVAPIDAMLTQPDGTVITATPYGDEWSSGYEYNGYTILQQADGYWVYALQTSRGGLIAGSRKAGIDAPPADQQTHLRDSQAAPAMQSLPSAPGLDWAGASGSQKLLIVLVDFTPSVSRGTSDAAWNQTFFDQTPGVKSVRNFYTQASYGAFSIDPAAETYGTVNDGVIAVQLGYAHPNSYPSDANNRLITRNALIAADAYIDFDSLDLDGSGALSVTELHLMIIVRGFEKSYGGVDFACTPSVWGHRGSLATSGGEPAPVLDGVTVAAYAYGGGYTQEGEYHQASANRAVDCPNLALGHMATIGIMAHELGHDIDWPDLYDTDGSSEGVGSWSLMSGGSWGRASGGEYSGTTPVLPDAFLKWYQGWLTPTRVTAPAAGVAVPNSAENATAYLLGYNPEGITWDFGTAMGTREYFLIENRQQNGFDGGLWDIDSAAEGCLIWHIDETRTSSNTANATEARRLVDLEEADGAQDMDLPAGSGGNQGDAGDPWPGSSANTAFYADSTPSSAWYDEPASGIALTNISTAGTGCTLDFSEVGPQWTGGAGASWNTPGSWSVERVPGLNETTVIPAGVGTWPAIDMAASVGNLTILDGAHLSANADVQFSVSGDWTELDSGYFDAGAGTVIFQAGRAQTIVSGANSHFNNLQIGGASPSRTVTAGSDLDVNGSLTIQPGASLAGGAHTLRVGGAWNDAPFGFIPGTSTVVLDGTAQSVQKAGSELTVYSSDFSDFTGWTTYDPNGGGWWGYSTATDAPNASNTGRHARYYWNTNPADDWLFSPGFNLQAGVTYTIRFNYGARSAGYPERLAVHIGATQTSAAMTTSVFDNSNVTNTAWQQGSGTFTPGASGTYYLGFHAYSLANRWELAVDDVSVSATDANLSFYNLTAAGTAALGDNAALLGSLLTNAGGSLDLGAYALTVEGSVTNNGGLIQSRSINAASTSFLRIQSAGGTDKYRGVEIDPGAGNMGLSTVTVWGNQLCPTATSGVLRCYELDPATPLEAAVTFYYTDAERGLMGNADMMVFHWDGLAWNRAADPVTRGGSGNFQWARAGSISNFSPFALSTVRPTALILTAFNVAGQDGEMQLSWETAFESTLLGFNVYRADSAQAIPAKLNPLLIPSQYGGANGGSYTFADPGAAAGKIYYYWIELVHQGDLPEMIGPVWALITPEGGFKVFLPAVR
jgi:M6 family metalloprotease-like protein